MTRRLVLVSLLALLALQLVPTVPAEGVATCSARTHQDVALPTPADTFYVRFTTGPWGALGSAHYAEVWRETNGIPGLQVSASYCVGVGEVEKDWFHGSVAVPDPRGVVICC